mgnify:FL=1
MAARMKRVVVLLAALGLMAGALVLGKYVLWPEQPDKNITENLDVDLSLHGVRLSQGRDGRKTWDLEAAGASYAEAGDELILTDPLITYWGESDGAPIRVMAPKGQVWQKKDRARMWEGVNASQGDYQMREHFLDYEGQNRTLVLTGEVEIQGKTMQGRTDLLTYFLQSGDFLAQGNVRVTLN